MNARQIHGIGCLIIMAMTLRAHAGVVVEGLGALNPAFPVSFAQAVSAGGSVVVGASTNSDGNQEAFRWTAQTGMVGLGDLSGGLFSSQANAVSADGTTVVGRSQSADGWEAFRWTAQDNMIGLDDFPDGSFGSSAFGVSGDGSIVVGFGRHDPYPEAFRWTQAEGMVGLGFLPGGLAISYGRDITPDGSVIVGDAHSANGSEVFRWTQDSDPVGLGNLGGDPATYRVSADGSTVVGQGPSEGQAFRWTEETGMVLLGEFPGGSFEMTATAVSADGAFIVGLAETPTGFHSFLWEETNGVRDLAQVMVDEFDLDLNGWALEQALGLSADGLSIVGVGVNPDGYTEAWLIQVPEPTTFALLISSSFALLRRRGCRRARS